jgi:hypothetical protein
MCCHSKAWLPTIVYKIVKHVFPQSTTHSSLQKVMPLNIKGLVGVSDPFQHIVVLYFLFVPSGKENGLDNQHGRGNEK